MSHWDFLGDNIIHIISYTIPFLQTLNTSRVGNDDGMYGINSLATQQRQQRLVGSLAGRFQERPISGKLTLSLQMETQQIIIDIDMFNIISQISPYLLFPKKHGKTWKTAQTTRFECVSLLSVFKPNCTWPWKRNFHHETAIDTWFPTSEYVLVNIQKTMERSTIFHG